MFSIEFKRREIEPIKTRSPAQIVQAWMAGIAAKILFAVVGLFLFWQVFLLIVVGVVNVLREAADYAPIPSTDIRWKYGYGVVYAIILWRIFRDTLTKR